MSTERKTLVVDGDVSKGVAALEQLKEKANETATAAGKIATNVAKVDEKAAEAKRGVAGIHNETKRAGGSATALTFGFNQAVEAVQKVVQGVQALDAAMQKSLGQKAVLDNLPFKIDAVRASTMGLIDDMTLSRVAVAANRSEVVKSEKDFAALAEAGTRLGLSVGQDATKSVEDLALALARGSPMILDNLGIQLKMSDAHKLYAERIGVSVSALTDEQKAMAFRTIGLEKAIEVSKKVTLNLSDSEQAWISARQQWDGLTRETLPAMTKEMGGVWGALAQGGQLAREILPAVAVYLGIVMKGLTPLVAVVSFFGRQLATVARIAGTAGSYISGLGTAAGEAKDGIVDWLTESKVNEWALSAKEKLAKLAGPDGIGDLSGSIKKHLPWAEDMALAWDDVARSITGATAAQHKMAAIAKAKDALGGSLLKAKGIAADLEATEARRLGTLKASASESEFQVKLAEAQKRPAAELEALYRAQHTAKLELLLATQDHAKLEQVMRDEELRQAKAKSSRRSGSRGPSEADRVKAAGDIQLQMWRDGLALQEAQALLWRTTDDEAQRFADVRYAISIQELRAEQDVLEVAHAKDKVERAKNEARLVAIDRELEILDIAKQAADADVARSEAKGGAEQRITELDREIERMQALGVETRLLERNRATAQEALLEQYGTAEEQAQFAHEQDLARIGRDREEAIASAELELEQFDQRMELREAEGLSVTEFADERLRLEMQVASAENDADKRRALHHKREVLRRKEFGRIYAQVQGATNSVMNQGSALFGAVAAAHEKNEEKRAKATMRFQGVMAMAKGAMEIVEGVIAIAGQNYLAGVLHFAAAATAFATGVPLMSGNLPNSASGGGGASGGASGGGGSFGRGAGFQSAYNEEPAQRDRPSVPPSAEELTRIRGGYGDGSGSDSGGKGGGGNVTNINAGIIVSNDQGHLVDEVANSNKKAWG